MTSDSGLTAPISPAPQLPATSAAVLTLIEDLTPFFDDAATGLQRLMARIPLLLDADRAYVARLSPDGARFTVTQSSKGDWPDLLGYSQSTSRLPAFVRGALKTGAQAHVDDANSFPLTPQQRKMLWYDGLRSTVITPIRSSGEIVGALVVDICKRQRIWDHSALEAFRSLAAAIGARLALSNFGDHLVSDERDTAHDLQYLNVLVNVAHVLETTGDPAAASVEIAERLGALSWVKSARLAAPGDKAEGVRFAAASEGLVVSTDAEGVTRVGLPLVSEGERFGGIELELAAPALSDVQEQFLRTVQMFAGIAHVSALRRARPRNEGLADALTGLPNFRAINEVLVDSVQAAKSSGRPLSVWLLDVGGLEGFNRDHGHAIGDDLVGYVGHMLQAAAAAGGSAGRVGGGIFLLMFPGLGNEEGPVQARMMLERVTKNVPAHLPQLALSIGVASYPADANGPDDLVRFARLALYAAKDLGKNRVVAAAPKNARWVSDARAAFVRCVTEAQLPASLQERR